MGFRMCIRIRIRIARAPLGIPALLDLPGRSRRAVEVADGGRVAEDERAQRKPHCTRALAHAYRTCLVCWHGGDFNEVHRARQKTRATRVETK